MRSMIENGVIDAPPETVRLMTGFGGGMQRGATCGTVVSAVAALGWVTGRTEPDQPRAASAEAVRRFLQLFEQRFGTITCAQLRAVYAKEHALRSEGMYRACTVFVEAAVELVRQVLEEMEQPQQTGH